MYGLLETQQWCGDIFSPSVSETDSNSLLPLECQFLNKNALNQLVGMQAPPIKHFALKRKPKSAALRAELLQKCKPLSLVMSYLQPLPHLCQNPPS